MQNGRLTARQLADAIGVSPATLRRWIMLNIVPQGRDPDTLTGWRSWHAHDVPAILIKVSKVIADRQGEKRSRQQIITLLLNNWHRFAASNPDIANGASGSPTPPVVDDTSITEGVPPSTHPHTAASTQDEEGT
jgi:hypothetical protein